MWDKKKKKKKKKGRLKKGEGGGGSWHGDILPLPVLHCTRGGVKKFPSTLCKVGGKGKTGIKKRRNVNEGKRRKVNGSFHIRKRDLQKEKKERQLDLIPRPCRCPKKKRRGLSPGNMHREGHQEEEGRDPLSGTGGIKKPGPKTQVGKKGKGGKPPGKTKKIIAKLRGGSLIRRR